MTTWQDDDRLQCTDCNERFRFLSSRGGRCPMCGSARVVPSPPSKEGE
jgi:DNA-directed RNA polymerase subunit RPC12/RpoP